MPGPIQQHTSIFSFQRATEAMPRLRSPAREELVKEDQRTTRVDGDPDGADRDRTGDPRLAKPVLSQLSYNPGGPEWGWLDSN